MSLSLSLFHLFTSCPIFSSPIFKYTHACKHLWNYEWKPCYPEYLKKWIHNRCNFHKNLIFTYFWHFYAQMKFHLNFNHVPFPLNSFLFFLSFFKQLFGLTIIISRVIYQWIERNFLTKINNFLTILYVICQPHENTLKTIISCHLRLCHSLYSITYILYILVREAHMHVIAFGIHLSQKKICLKNPQHLFRGISF